MTWLNTHERPHPAFAESYRAYSNYLRDLARGIEDSYGAGDSLASGVHTAVLGLPTLHAVQRRPLDPAVRDDFESGLRKGWGFLRRVQREVEDGVYFDEEANALLPYMCWYAVHHVGRAFAVASGQTVPRNHLALLRALGSSVVTRHLLPLPWGAWCEGCPQTGDARFGGLDIVESVHVLSTPDPSTAADRLALVLRTTREKDLNHAFDGLRRRDVAPGRTRRNLTPANKRTHADSFAPTTLFDFLYRLRTRASYGEADLFVLGSRDEQDARQLAEALAVICDATVASLEALIAAYAGPSVMAESAEAYSNRTGSTLVAHRADAWKQHLVPLPRKEKPPSRDEDIPF